MNLDQMIAARNSASTRMITLYAVTFFSVVAEAYIILAFGPGASFAGKVLLGLIVISIALFAVLSIPSVLSELVALRTDKPRGLDGPAYEGYIDQLPLSMFSALTVAAHLATAAAALWAIFG